MEDDIYCTRIFQGSLAEEFQKYMDQHTDKTERNTEKFCFLILTEIVLECKDKFEQRQIFNRLVSLFFDEKGKYYNYIKLSNRKLAGEMFSFSQNKKKWFLMIKFSNIWEKLKILWISGKVKKAWFLFTWSFDILRNSMHSIGNLTFVLACCPFCKRDCSSKK